MDLILSMVSQVDFTFVLLIFAGAFAGLFVGAIPGLSVKDLTYSLRRDRRI